MSGQLLQVFADGKDEDKVELVGRLSDMDTREVSLVDRAANKRKFLVIKRDEGENMNLTKTAQLKVDDKTTTEVETKKVVCLRLEEAITRLDVIKAAVEATETKKDANALPAEVKSELRAVQCSLKGLAGISKSAFVVVASATDLSKIDGVSDATKKETTKVIDEVSRRLGILKVDLAQADILDAKQARAVDSAADMISTVVTSKVDAIVKASLTDEQRTVALASIAKAMIGLSDVYVGLQTDVIVKGHVADQFQVGSVLHDHVSAVEDAVAKMLTGVKTTEGAEPVRHVCTAIEGLRAVQKAIGDQAGVAVAGIAGQVVEIAKAATMFKTKTNWELPDGDPAKYRVVRVMAPTPPEQVAAFATRIEAENEALKRNIEAVTTATTKSAATSTDTTNQTQEVEVTGAKTEKIGAPMQGDRLNRLKGVVKLYKEALGDLKAGSVSLEKFKKVGDLLGVLLTELQVGKMQAAAVTGGVEDKRGTTPDAPNVGSGVQPDTSVVGTVADVFGDGTPDELANILKKVEEIEKRSKESTEVKDSEIAKLRQEIVMMRKTRQAPSTPPQDGDDAASSGSDESVYWPRDMANWDPKKD